MATIPHKPKPRKVATNEAINQILRESGFYDAARQVLEMGYGDVTIRVIKARQDGLQDGKQYLIDIVTETSQRSVIRLT